MDSKKVVVVGGGVAGTLVAKKLEQDANVTLIDPYGSLHNKDFSSLISYNADHAICQKKRTAL